MCTDYNKPFIWATKYPRKFCTASSHIKRVTQVDQNQFFLNINTDLSFLLGTTVIIPVVPYGLYKNNDLLSTYTELSHWYLEAFIRNRFRIFWDRVRGACYLFTGTRLKSGELHENSIRITFTCCKQYPSIPILKKRFFTSK